MEKLDLKTPNLSSGNVEKLAALFPDCITESLGADGRPAKAINLDALRQLLSPVEIVEGPRERYQLDWPGKRAALALANTSIDKTLRPAREESVEFDATRNLYIEGDNLDALKLLQETYLGKVRMIYIDPPYNTGNDFIYDDDFSLSREEYRNTSGELDEDGNAMFVQEKWQQNSSAGGRFHSEWLSMMYPRLKLARNLLKENGFLFVSISDMEYHNLVGMLDQIFGQENRIETFIWESIFRPSNMSKRVRGNAEYVVAYAKDASIDFELIERLEDPQGDASLTQNNNKPRDLRFPAGSLRIEMAEGVYSSSSTPEVQLRTDLVVAKGTNATEWIVSGKFKWSQEYLEAEISKGVLLKVKTTTLIPYYRKVYQQTPLRPKKILPRDLVSDVLSANAEISQLFGQGYFDYPKPTSLIAFFQRTFGISGDDIILDFFSGSGSTAHAVMKLNSDDGGRRRHIMVQIPQPCDEKSEAFNAGYKTIPEIGKERIRRAGAKIRKEMEDKLAKELPGSDEHTSLKARLGSLDTGFRVLKIDSGSRTDIFTRPAEIIQGELSMQVDNLKTDRTEEDLLFQVLLDWGTDLLAAPIHQETIAGKKVFFVDGNALAACFATGVDDALIKGIAARSPIRAVFRDSGFASDAAKINTAQLFKALSPHTDLKTI